jgi:hypothetical protein
MMFKINEENDDGKVLRLMTRLLFHGWKKYVKRMKMAG